MTFLNGIFYIFLLVTLAVFYVTPKQYRYMVISIASLVFYGWNGPKFLLGLLIVAAITYTGGLLIEKAEKKKPVYLCFFFATILVLALCKYTSLPMLVGLSFYVFQATAYLGDVYRGRLETEKNPVRYLAFVAFFPTLLCGPIQKARNLLPQIKNPADFNSERFFKGLLLLGWGFLEKLLIADKLGEITNTVYVNYETETSVRLALAALLYSLYIYADFNAYSDMARGVAKLLGIEVGRNFENPYLSKSCGEFWRRWHVSLNDWFVENIYIPLGGSRKGTARKLLNMMLIFFVSGLWHGNGYNFLVWGLVNGLLAVISVMLPWNKKKAPEGSKISIFFRRVIVYLLISGTWIFFANGTKPSLVIIKKILRPHMADFANIGLVDLFGGSFATGLLIICLFAFVLVQILRAREKEWYERFVTSPVAVRWLVGGLMLYSVIMAATQAFAEATANTAGAQFIYFNF